MLTDTEYSAFTKKFPEDYADRIDELSIYLATSGKEYKNHYATLLSFAKTRFAEREASFNMGNRHNMGNGCGNFTAQAECPAPKPKLKYADFDPEEELQKAIRRSGFFDDEE